ncbi:MAG TPA: hypothetical protein VFH11_09070 [Gemmatimonadota bacterium]|nr:hypothetical protein [Gemmatimonadota bacterium]
MNETGRPLTSPVYLSALTLLVANDWLLKSALHNGLTGKLSDLAGLFAVTWLGVVVLPRWRWLLSGTVAIAFVYWKSPYSDALIAAWNGLNLFPIGRVVDFSDCVALAMVPVAHVHASRIRETVRRPITRCAVIAISLLAFTGTSLAPEEHEYNRTYSFSIPSGELRRRLIAAALYCRESSPMGILAPEELHIGVPTEMCGAVTAIVRIEEAPKGAKVRLIQISGCPGGTEERAPLLEAFEAGIIEKIGPDP